MLTAIGSGAALPTALPTALPAAYAALPTALPYNAAAANHSPAGYC
ncbi:MAG: hypothetical protein ACYDGY_02755 [Acidimicrobiales bacterium]